MTITVKSRKAKGRNFQDWVMKKISEITGIKCGKDELISSRPMGQSGTDIILIGKALELLPVSIEIKNQESWSLPAWIKQTKSNKKEGTDWLLFCTKNRFDKVVVMDAEVFFELYRQILSLKDLLTRQKGEY
jgi:hypothetical protein